jgi:hypothetical protein
LTQKQNKGHLYFFDKSTNIEERRNKRERKEKKVIETSPPFHRQPV